MGSQAWSLSPQPPGRAAGGAWLWNMWNPLVTLHSYGKLPRESWFIVDLLFFLLIVIFKIMILNLFFSYESSSDGCQGVILLIWICWCFVHIIIGSSRSWGIYSGSIIAYLICSPKLSIWERRSVKGWTLRLKSIDASRAQCRYWKDLTCSGNKRGCQPNGKFKYLTQFVFPNSCTAWNTATNRSRGK